MIKTNSNFIDFLENNYMSENEKIQSLIEISKIEQGIPTNTETLKKFNFFPDGKLRLPFDFKKDPYVRVVKHRKIKTSNAKEYLSYYDFIKCKSSLSKTDIESYRKDKKKREDLARKFKAREDYSNIFNIEISMLEKFFKEKVDDSNISRICFIMDKFKKDFINFEGIDEKSASKMARFMFKEMFIFSVSEERLSEYRKVMGQYFYPKPAYILNLMLNFVSLYDFLNKNEKKYNSAINILKNVLTNK